MVTKAKYLGSLLLPSPIEREVNLSLFKDRIEMPELDVAINLDKIDKVRAAKGSDLPAQTIMMAAVIGLAIDKEKEHVVIEWKTDTVLPDGILLRFENDGTTANMFATEVSRNMHKGIVDSVA